MDNLILQILQVEDNSTDVLLLEEALEEVVTSEFELTTIGRLDGALNLLREKLIDVVLLDLGLPDSQGLETFATLQNQYPKVPVLILSGLDDETIALHAVQEGAQDYLFKGAINSKMLTRAIRYAIERKRSEQKILASEENYRRLFETAHDGILILDAGTGQIIDANAFIVELLGFSIEEFVGKRLWEIAPFRDKLASQAAFRTLQHEGFISYSDLPLTSKDGRQIDVEFVSNIYEAGGQRVIQCNIRDTTERKQAEEALRISIDRFEILSRATNDIVWDWNLLTDEVRWNDSIQTLLGYDRKSLEPGADSWKRRIHPDDLESVSCSIEAAIQGGQQSWVDEYRFKKADDSYAVIFDRGFIIRDDKGQPIRMVGSMQDITARKESEEALRQSEQRYQSIVANTPGTVYQLLYRPDGSIEIPFVNEGCRTLYEMEPEALQQNPTFPENVVHPDDRPQKTRSVIESMKTLAPWSCEWRIRLPSGKTKWIQGAARPQRLPDGSTLFDGLLMDITARKEAEEERDRFFTLSLDMLAIIGSDGYIKRLNPAFGVTIGFSDSELMAVPFLEFVHPDDYAATLKAMEKLESGIELLNFENRYRCRDGSYKWLRWMVAPFEELWYSVAHDVTTIKKAEAALHKANDELELHVLERTNELSQTTEQLQLEMIERRRTSESLYKNHELLQAVLENTAEGIVACDADGELTFFNRATRDFHGLPTETLSMQQWPEYYSLYLPDGITPMQKEEAPLFRALNGEHVRNVEMVIIARDGSTRLVLNNGEPLFDVDGASLGAVVVMHDITARKQAEVELQRAKEEADAANHAKSEFLSRMSHELRTPLNAILGFGQILERQQLPPISKDSVTYILKGGRHLLDLINEVLDIARVESGHLELSLEPVGVNEIVSEACALVRPLASERKICINEAFSKMGDSFVTADRQRLKQVLINLLSNAIKYNGEGGHIEILCEQKPDGWISIAVHDSGPGILPADLSKLFTPFERLNASNTTIEGTGLGLALSQKMMMAMGGTLSARSTPGQGSTFTIELMQATLSEKQLEDFSEKTQFLEITQRSEQTYSVLCIEDNPSNVRLIEAIFESRPEITLLAAIQGSIGLDMARQHQPNLILLDLNLPDISGKEVLARLQQSDVTRDIPVVVVSADATPSQIEHLLATGAGAYLTKPLDINQFLTTVDNFLQASVATDKTEKLK